MKKYLSYPLMFLITIAAVSCGPVPEFKDFNEVDLSPPVLLQARTLSSEIIELEFNEKTNSSPDSITILPEIEIINISSVGQKLQIITKGQIPGFLYTIKAVIWDDMGNSMNIMTSIYGYNPSIPKVVINEFITQGSKNHPDLVELKVLSSGNMGGLVIYEGTPNNWDDRFIFPSFMANEGDFILIHFKPQGITEEINETTKKDESGGLDSSDSAYDFWINEGSGISGNNGVIALYERPGGPMIDGVLYSNRTSLSDENYMGFGTKDAMERALELWEDYGWYSEEDHIRPEDGVNPDYSTSTRSICRINGQDTNTKQDWYIVPTRKSTFGSENNQEVYIP
jgi:hypothetical protein